MKKENILLVQYLIEILKDLPQDIPFGGTDDFGELIPIDKYDISIKWDVSKGWNNRKAMHVQIYVPEF